jgi:hypothetical protein
MAVREQRKLVNLARSALADAYFELQRNFDVHKARWQDWFSIPAIGAERVVEPVSTREALRAGQEEALHYEVGDVQVVRVRPIPENAGFGLVDLKVTVRARARPPDREAVLTLVERHTLWFADNYGPIQTAGRVIEMSPTPAATQIDMGNPATAAAAPDEHPAERALAIVHTDLTQAVQSPDRLSSVTITGPYTQLIVGELRSDGTIAGTLVAYRRIGDKGARRLRMQREEGLTELPGTYDRMEFTLLDASGGPYARMTFFPQTAPARLGAPGADAPRAPFTALVRIKGPEMIGSQIFDWSFMDGLKAVRFLRADQ